MMQSSVAAAGLRRFGPLALPAFGQSLHYLTEKVWRGQTPSTVAEWSQVFDIDSPVLRKWRTAVAEYNANLGGASEAPPLSSSPHAAMLSYAVRDLDVIMSPLVELSETPLGMELVARRNIQPGAFIASVPLEAAISASPPPLPSVDDQNTNTRALETYVVAVEDLAAQLLMLLADSEEPLHPYATFLRSIPPPKNMPYLGPNQLREKDGIAAYLRAVFEQEFKSPLCPALHGVDEANIRWAVSVVLSRRVGTSLLVPVVDFLNHSHSPNCYYSTPTTASDVLEKNLSAVNIFDNLLAGIPEDSLIRPYMHVFAITHVDRGTPLCLSYSQQDPAADDGRDAWLSQWGFVPSRRAEATAKELEDAAMVVVRHNVLSRKTLFPPAKGDADTSKKIG